ncbi:MAG: Co2+/Mg2+ efflux protein ApaG [Methylococcales bacterium]
MGEQNKISVETVPCYLPSKSSPKDNRYVFAYTITISNRGAVAATLLSRYWLITDSNGKTQEVSGDGVVGAQPYLKPGESFQYTSGAMLETPIGVMQGKYILISDDGINFNCPIPRFTLSIPRTLH